jgi:hypothetical protein
VLREAFGHLAEMLVEADEKKFVRKNSLKQRRSQNE